MKKVIEVHLDVDKLRTDFSEFPVHTLHKKLYFKGSDEPVGYVIVEEDVYNPTKRSVSAIDHMLPKIVAKPMELI